MEGAKQTQAVSVDELFYMPSVVVAAHEMKSPLALIRQLALDLEASVQTAEQQQLSRRVRLMSEQTMQLVADITRAQRLEDSLFACEPINPRAVCEEVAHELSPLFREHRRQLAVQPRRHTPLVVANRDLLKRILVNFATNALHYSAENEPVALQTSMHAGKIRVAVRDRGPQIPRAVWRSLAATQQPLPQPDSRRPQSSSLGLHLSKQFAEAMSGRVGLVRHADGASFFVELLPSTQLSLL